MVLLSLIMEQLHRGINIFYQGRADDGIFYCSIILMWVQFLLSSSNDRGGKNEYEMMAIQIH